MQVLELKNIINKRLNIIDSFCRSVEGPEERMSESEDATKGRFTQTEKRWKYNETVQEAVRL